MWRHGVSGHIDYESIHTGSDHNQWFGLAVFSAGILYTVQFSNGANDEHHGLIRGHLPGAVLCSEFAELDVAGLEWHVEHVHESNTHHYVRIDPRLEHCIIVAMYGKYAVHCSVSIV